MPAKDPSLDTLLDLDGQVLVVDPAGEYWVKFDVRRVPPTPQRPHSLSYSLTLHGPGGERLFGLDNAHAVRRGGGPGGKGGAAQDHRHRLRTIRSYDYKDSATLLADFWSGVDAILKDRGVIP